MGQFASNCPVFAKRRTVGQGETIFCNIVGCPLRRSGSTSGRTFTHRSHLARASSRHCTAEVTLHRTTRAVQAECHAGDTHAGCARVAAVRRGRVWRCRSGHRPETMAMHRSRMQESQGHAGRYRTAYPPVRSVRHRVGAAHAACCPPSRWPLAWGYWWCPRGCTHPTASRALRRFVMCLNIVIA